MSDATAKALALVLRHREENGHLHLHHRGCIHNLPPEDQIRVRGKTVEWWMTMVGRMPEQITPEQWQCEPPRSVDEILAYGLDRLAAVEEAQARILRERGTE